MIPNKEDLTDNVMPSKWWQKLLKPIIFIAKLVIVNQKGIKGTENVQIVKDAAAIVEDNL